jgi:hypothetical protein
MKNENSVHAIETHDWLRPISLAYLPGSTTPLVDQFAQGLLDTLRSAGHAIMAAPGPGLDALLTTVSFNEAVNWRDAFLFTARRRFNLEHPPTVFTIVHVRPAQFREILAYFEAVLAKEPPDPADFAFPGLTDLAYHILYEQGRRGGPMMALVRLLQAQSKSVRIILLVGDERPEEAYCFDLVGAFPRTDGSDPQAFYQDLLQRILTAVCVREVTDHQLVEPPIPLEVWKSLRTPIAMRKAGIELGRLNFFTEMVRVAYLTNVPAVHDAISSQYSEGCFASWDPEIGALVTTVTGSARPVEKDHLSDDELAVIAGLRPDGEGALIRHVEGKRNDPPSSEAVEMIAMDGRLPRITLGPGWETQAVVPVVRSKLHGHRGVRSFDPRFVEHVHLDPAYYHYPVSCSTDAQARAISSAFARSQALNDPADPRQVVFTVMPGHGSLFVEKWVPGKAPFQVIWEAMDAGQLRISNAIPQGPFSYLLNGRGDRCNLFIRSDKPPAR